MRSFVLLTLLAACVPSQPITVVHVGEHGIPDDVDGDPVTMRHPSGETFAAVQSGAYVVRDARDWEAMWKGAADRPALPDELDPTSEMLVVVATEDEIVSKLEITRAVETAGQMTVFVRQTMLGHGCVERREERAGVDAVVTRRVDKPLKFYIEDEDGGSCGEPPKTTIGCRLAAAPSWSTKLTAKTGDLVECELSTIANGKYELIDQMITLSEAPPQSKAKLAYPEGPTRATLALDAFGTYAVRAEATDEAGRRGKATALIEVTPKKTRDVLIQLTWADVDTNELATPLPRVLLRVAQNGPRGQRCSAEVPVPGLCKASTRGPYTYMKIPASRRKLGLSLLYLDERAQAGPSPCVNVWFKGERTASSCDRDHRHAEDRWDLGTLQTWTGKVVPPKPPPEPKTGDDAGGKKATPKKAPSGKSPTK